jgi:D-amino peptidase
MTKLFISADLEGACWVTSPRQCFPELDRPAYDLAIAHLAKEVEVVAQTALEAGVSDIIVNDSHGYMTNLTLQHFSPEVSSRIQLLSGKPKKCAMAAGLDSACTGAVYIGYHAKAGTANGILNHTFHSKLFDVRVNGISYGEGGINALYASLEYGVPVILASGDQAFCQEIKSVIPGVETVQTKESLSFAAALSRPLGDVLNEYRDKTHQLLSHPEAWRANLLTLAAPYTLEVTFINSLSADVAMTMPWLEAVDGRTVRYTAQTFRELYQALQSCYAILSYSSYMED